MLEEIVLLALCSLIAVAGLAVAGWEVITGRLFSMDGLWLTLIALTLAAVFGANVAWSAYTGEVFEVLRQLRKQPAGISGADKDPKGPA